MCRIPKRIQHVDRTASSAEEDNWDDDKIQKINNNKKKGVYIYVTLLVYNAPINFIIDSGSSETLIPQHLFNKTTKVETMNTDYKDVNDNKNEFVGQTIATVRTNRTSSQLPLLITKANITLLMGLDWMKPLKITINSSTEAIKIHNIGMDENEKKILTLKNEFKVLFYNNTEIKDICSQDYLKRKREHKTTKWKTITNPPTRPGCRRTEKNNKERISRKSNGDHRRLLRKPCRYNGKEG